MEELDFQGLLDHFTEKGFQKGEQVILGHFGTVQTLLSLIFGVPVKVDLIQQSEKEHTIKRTVNLVCREQVVALAVTQIPTGLNHPEVLLDITAGKLGLGQIVVLHQIPNKRNLISVGRDEGGFWRSYTIEGPQLFLEISEFFPRLPFEEIGWLKKEVGRG